MAQSIRRSQYITTYGPGSILEGSNGPRVIPVLEYANLFNSQNPPRNFEITDQRLSQGLLNGTGVVRIPSNAELGVIETRSLYDTKRFPNWSLCPLHHILYHKSQNDEMACPRCGRLRSTNDAWEQANRQSIRFVQACLDGHLDDVEWIKIAHPNHRNCYPSYLLWQGSGSALRNIIIRCPICNDHGNFGQAYNRDWECTGRFPENEPTTGSSPNRPRGCDKPARIIQRGAANLRLPEIVSSLTIPPRATNLHRLLEMNNIQVVLLTQTFNSKAQFIQSLSILVQRNMITQAIVDEIDRYPENQILQAIQDLQTRAPSQDPQTYRLDEFDALRNAASFGHPPQPSSTPGGPPQFEIIQHQVRRIPGPEGRLLRITPVNRLRVVMVQTGYRRVPGGNPNDAALVDCRYSNEGRYWYPGVELFGEGVFIDLDPDTHEDEHFPLSGQEANTWLDAWYQPDQFEQNLIRPGDRDQLHPVFVWWHTLSHRLINALSVDSGYSSAAVRERVFIHVEENTGKAIGGVLLYTAQPGGDGTLGGLVALVPQFENTLHAAFRTIDACSNDPLCGEESFGPGKYNGAACYACSLVSETSCEHRNMRLDRNLLLKNLP